MFKILIREKSVCVHYNMLSPCGECKAMKVKRLAFQGGEVEFITISELRGRLIQFKSLYVALRYRMM